MTVTLRSALNFLRRSVLLVALGLGCCIATKGDTQVPSPNVEGVVVMASSPYTFLALEGTPGRESGWLKPGDTWEGYTVVDIIASTHRVVVTNSSGKRMELSFDREIKRAQPLIKAPVVSGLVPLEDLDWDWIRSDANDMRDRVIDLPEEIALLWPQIDRQEQIRIKNHYRIRGINLSVSHRENIIHVSHQRIRDPQAKIVPIPVYRIAPPGSSNPQTSNK